jgi:hypothetical protein
LNWPKDFATKYHYFENGERDVDGGERDLLSAIMRRFGKTKKVLLFLNRERDSLWRIPCATAGPLPDDD